jgi:hypothetical protein
MRFEPPEFCAKFRCHTKKRRFSRVLWRLFTLLAQAFLFELGRLKGGFGLTLLALDLFLDFLNDACIVTGGFEVDELVLYRAIVDARDVMQESE